MMRGGPYAVRPARQEREARLPQPREAPPPQSQALPVERPPEPVGRPGRLTPDERRALRQQIIDAGRDIYRVPRP